MKLPRWYLIQLVVWLLTSVPLYAFVALWGGYDWWLIDNIFDSDLSAWEIILFTVIFFHAIITLPIAVASIAWRRQIAAH
jgi:hypothetical protein